MAKGRRWSLTRLFWRYFRLVSGRLGLASLCTVGGAGIDLLKAWPLKIIIDHVLLSHPLPPSLNFLQPVMTYASNSEVLLFFAGSIVAISICGALISYAEVYFTTSLGYDLVYALRRELFSHLQTLSLSFHNRAQSGDMLYRIGSETSAIKDIITDSFLKLTEYALTVVGACWVIFAMNRNLGLIAVIVLPLLGLRLAQVYRTTKRTAREQKRIESRVAGRINEVLRAIPLVQAFAQEEYEEARYDAATEQTKQAGIRIARLEAAASRTTQVLVSVGIAATVIYGAHQVLNGILLPGDLVLIVGYVKDMWKPVRRIAKTAGDFSKNLASLERVAEILDIEPEIQDSPDAIEADALRGNIEFRDVSFQYVDGKIALRSVCFSVRKGQKVSLVGASGAGKSTIVSLLLRLYDPHLGAVLVDGVDIRTYRRESFRRQIGLVLQESILFGATVGENIAYGRPEATQKEIEAAARAANAHGFIREMEDGYDTVVGERGATLSGGQRQRIAIARALIRDPAILILDEPMTGLDAENQQVVREALNHLMAGRTCIQVTHDLTSVVDSDVVILLDEGRVLDSGTHAELVARNTRYRGHFGHEAPAADVATPPPVAPSPAADVATPPPITPSPVTPSPAPRQPKRPERSAAFPADAEMPQLEVAADPRQMLEIFRASLVPADGRSFDLRGCAPARFRCRQSTNRCVMQYSVQVTDQETGRERSTWVTGILYARPGEAERLWGELRDDPGQDGIPEEWKIFEPVAYVPELSMLLQVFPYDRRLPTLGPVLSGALDFLGPRLLPQPPGGAFVRSHSVEPTRYRTELGAALVFSARTRDYETSTKMERRCFLKVGRNGDGEEVYRLLQSFNVPRWQRRLRYRMVRPLGYLPELRTLVLEEAPGRSLQTLMTDGHDADAAGRAIARAVAALNTDDAAGLRPHPLTAQRTEVEHAAGLVTWAFPEAADDVRAVTEIVSGLEEVPPAPIHRDLKPDHIFLEDDRVTFIDCDAVAAGDPVRDAAHLYAHLMCRVGMDSAPTTVSRAVALSFVDEYFANVPRGWRESFPVHCAGAFVEVAGSIFKRQEPGWRERAREAVAEAQAALSGGVA
jgi:ATP-binding cassette, subfamily B, bacterial